MVLSVSAAASALESSCLQHCGAVLPHSFGQAPGSNGGLSSRTGQFAERDRGSGALALAFESEGDFGLAKARRAQSIAASLLSHRGSPRSHWGRAGLRAGGFGTALCSQCHGVRPQRAYAAVSAVMAFGPHGQCKTRMLLYVPPCKVH